MRVRMERKVGGNREDRRVEREIDKESKGVGDGDREGCRSFLLSEN